MKTLTYSTPFRLLLFVAWSWLGIMPATAGIATEVVENGVRALAKAGSKEIVKDTSEEAATAVGMALGQRGLGHLSAEVVEQASSHAATAARLLAEHGEAALPLVRNARALQLVENLGEDATQALLRHPEVAESLLARQESRTLAQALAGVSDRNARRLAMLVEDGLPGAGQRSEDILQVIRRYGDEAMDFIWRNKGSLSVAAVLGSFLHDPEPYLKGLKKLEGDAVKPMAEHAARAMEPVITWLSVLLGGAVLLLMTARRFTRKAPESSRFTVNPCPP